LSNVKELTETIVDNVEKVIVGKRDTVELAMLVLLCEGHILIEDVPGVGKTMLARSLAVSLGCSFKRVQFTPDLLPNDVTGVSVYNQRTGDFEFRPGPTFANILLADEINRATPRTQSSLLECMGERQVTVDGVTHKLARPYLVMATQNPVEFEGTFPLPEAQLDRFFVRLDIGYPSLEDERAILDSQRLSHPIDSLTQVTDAQALIECQDAIGGIHVERSVVDYILAVARGTREHRDVALGASPRGSLALYRLAQSMAAVRGRNFVIPDDVKGLARYVLSHRIIMKPESQLRGTRQEEVVESVMESLEVPIRSE
jgi:MoxR-like ATPase